MVLIQQIEQLPRIVKGPVTDPIRECLSLSIVAWRGTINGELACVWGLIPPTLMSSQAYLWLHTAPALAEHPFLFVRHSQRMIAEMLKDFPIIKGHCHVEAEKSIRWVKWLGGKFGEPDGLRVPFTIIGRG